MLNSQLRFEISKNRCNFNRFRFSSIFLKNSHVPCIGGENNFNSFPFTLWGFFCIHYPTKQKLQGWMEFYIGKNNMGGMEVTIALCNLGQFLLQACLKKRGSNPKQIWLECKPLSRHVGFSKIIIILTLSTYIKSHTKKIQ